MTPEQREELKAAAQEKMRAKAESVSDYFTISQAFDDLATPEMVLSLIAQVEALPVPQWISVDDRLPHYIDTVMITDGAVVKTGSLDMDATGAPCWFEYFTVTHWMPAPAAPTIPAIPGTKEGA